MRRVNRSALVPHSAANMYALADDIEAYPEFLPWCAAAEVHTRSGDIVEATLEIRRAGIHKSFMTRNRVRANERIDISLVRGPFRHLAGSWYFEALDERACKVSLQLEFDFDHAVASLFFGRVFEEICSSLVDAFTRRADDVYSAGH